MKLGFVSDKKDSEKMGALLTFVSPFLSVSGCEAEVIDPKNAILNWKNFDILLLFMDIREEFNRKHFFHFAQQIKTNIPIINDPDLWLWESDSSRFEEYKECGVQILPTVKCDSLKGFTEACGAIGSAKFSVWSGSDQKQIFEAGSDDLFSYVNKNLKKRQVILQQYLPSMETEGIISFFFFGGRFSHAIKRLGGESFRFSPSESDLDAASYCFNSTIDIVSERLFSPQAALPLITAIDFARDGGVLVQVDQRFFTADLYMAENPIASVNFVNALLEQINIFDELGVRGNGAFQ